MYCEPLVITSVSGPDGKELGRLGPRCNQVIEQDVADKVTSILQGVLTKGTGKAAQIGRLAAGKTGTTNGPTAAWFDGYTPDFAGSVWVGHPTNPRTRPLRGIHGVRIVYGGTFPAMIWRDVMLALHEGVPPSTFELPAAKPRPRPVRKPPGPTPSASPSGLPIPPDPEGKRPPDKCKHSCPGSGA
jgi:membrane peptidoglycan carboxypeptidase